MPKGGARPGAGRKPKPKIFATKKQAESAFRLLGTEYKGKQLPTRDELWLRCLLNEDPRISFNALVYLTDREQGKAAQQVTLDGNLAIDLTARRERIRDLLSRLAGKA